MSNEIKVSATRLSSFLSCKLKYWYGYCKKVPKVDNPSFRLGTAVHESLEFAGKIWLEKGDKAKSFTAAETKKILSFYDQVSIREGLGDFDIHLEGRELVASRLKKFLSGRKLISLETKFGFYGKTNYVVTKDGVPLMGAIDKVEEYDKDTLLIIDYKTSKTAPTSDQLRNDTQLSIYNYVARQLWPGYKRVILALDLLKSDIVYTYRTDEEREYFEEYLGVVYNAMVNFTEKEAKPSINMFCPWCDFRDYCHAYEVACKKSEYEFMPVMSLSDNDLIAEWNVVKTQKKSWRCEKKNYRWLLRKRLKRIQKT
jgi:putative RecB family exonuclease